MKFSWSTCAKSRAWSKAIRRIRPRFKSLEETFAAVDRKHPIHETMLVGITDDRSKDFFEEIPNANGYYQVLVGFDALIGPGVENDRQLARALFQPLSRAILACPFAVPDRVSVKAALDAWASANLEASE